MNHVVRASEVGDGVREGTESLILAQWRCLPSVYVISSVVAWVIIYE